MNMWPNRIVAIILFVASGLWVYLSIQLPFPAFARVAKIGPGHYPAGVAAFMIFLSILFFIQTLKQKDLLESQTQEEESTDRALDNRALYTGTALFVGYVILMPLIGFLLASMVFVFCFIRIIGRYAIVLTTTLAVLIPGLLWGLFARLLTVPLPKGPWGF